MASWPKVKILGWVLQLLSPWRQCQANRASEPPPLTPTRPTSGILSPKSGVIHCFLHFHGPPWILLRRPGEAQASQYQHLFFRSKEPQLIAQVVTEAGRQKLGEMRGLDLITEPMWRHWRRHPHPHPPSSKRGDPELKGTKRKASVTPAPLGTMCSLRRWALGLWEAETKSPLHHHHQDTAGS